MTCRVVVELLRILGQSVSQLVPQPIRLILPDLFQDRLPKLGRARGACANLMLLMTWSLAPLLINVALSTPLVVSRGTLPNLTLVGLTAALGSNVRYSSFSEPLTVAVNSTQVRARTGIVVTSNGTDCTPTGTTTSVATGLAFAALPLPE